MNQQNKGTVLPPVNMTLGALAPTPAGERLAVEAGQLLEAHVTFADALPEPPTVARLRQLGPLTDDNLLIFRDRTPKGRHYTERPGAPPDEASRQQLRRGLLRQCQVELTQE